MRVVGVPGERPENVDVTFSKRTWGLGGPALRLGFRQIKGLREDHARLIEQARLRIGQFKSVEHLHRLTHLPVATLRRLAEADAFGSMGLSRRQAIWQAMALRDDAMPLYGEESSPKDELQLELPLMPLGQEIMTDYRTAGLSLKRHPVALLRDDLAAMKIIPAEQISAMPHGQWVRACGLVLIRQRPATASGIVFMTLEDETGIVNLIVKSDVYDRFRPAARGAGLLLAEGRIQRQGQVIHLMVSRMEDLSHKLGGLELRSRDFH